MPNKTYDYFSIEYQIIQILSPRQVNGKTEYQQYSQSEIKTIINRYRKENNQKLIDDPQMKRVIDLFNSQGKIQQNNDETWTLTDKYLKTLNIFREHPIITQENIANEIIANFNEINSVYLYELLVRRTITQNTAHQSELNLKKELETTLHDKENLTNYLHMLIDSLFSQPQPICLSIIEDIRSYFEYEMEKYTTGMQQYRQSTDNTSKKQNDEVA